MVKYRKLLGEVLLVSFVLQLFALVTPLFFQVVMDKVLVHRGLTTLDVIAVGLLVVMLFEVVLSGMRTYVFAHTTSRIDVELGARLFRHLLNLPLAYFQARRVGDTVARVRELENIRQFLTGNAITVVLDLLFSVVFIAVMLLYSGWLTLVVLALAAAVTCCFRWHHAAAARAPAREVQPRRREPGLPGGNHQRHRHRQGHGRRAADDPPLGQAARRLCQRRLPHRDAGHLAHEGVNLIGKLVTVATMWLGARLVIEGNSAVGQLIAFNMLAGRSPARSCAWRSCGPTSSRPASRCSAWATSSTPAPSSAGSRAPLPPLAGRIEFDQVVFRYRPDGPEVLRGISLTIAPGEVIGIVGRSGSGKSTLAKLVQRLYVPERGRVLVDGIDLALADSLQPAPPDRRGAAGEHAVQPQHPRQHRAGRPRPAAGGGDAAAKLAGAHEFILELPEGYDTLVGEHGSTLSGGQRQRIAIARALIGNPRILIFDEATSALDYESERIIQNNMKAICQGRTVIVIAHRLSAVRDANRIIVIDRGQIVEQGSHAELLRTRPGITRGCTECSRGRRC
jgi:subfamily B ATP-binding cassette protein HlyB/CyaB